MTTQELPATSESESYLELSFEDEKKNFAEREQKLKSELVDVKKENEKLSLELAVITDKQATIDDVQRSKDRLEVELHDNLKEVEQAQEQMQQQVQRLTVAERKKQQLLDLNEKVERLTVIVAEHLQMLEKKENVIERLTTVEAEQLQLLEKEENVMERLTMVEAEQLQSFMKINVEVQQMNDDLTIWDKLKPLLKLRLEAYNELRNTLEDKKKRMTLLQQRVSTQNKVLIACCVLSVVTVLRSARLQAVR